MIDLDKILVPGGYPVSAQQIRDEIASLRAKLASTRDALGQYALSSNWQRNARFDPNNPWFDGISFALIALVASEKKDDWPAHDAEG